MRKCQGKTNVGGDRGPWRKANPSTEAALCVVFVVSLVAGQILHFSGARAETNATEAARSIPLPRPNPNRGAIDPIGALISTQIEAQASPTGAEPPTQTVLTTIPPAPATTASNERSMIAEFLDSPVVENGNQVGVSDCRQSMGDDDPRHLHFRREGVHRSQQRRFRGGIQGARCLVENQDARFAK